MSQGVFQPVGQKRLTNIAVVRMKKHGKRFEIACYKNKVVNWRNGVEKDLDEVLQTTAVFANVSKGVLAKKEDLMLAFGTDNTEVVCLKILAEGEMQVSDKERKVELDTLFRDVASVLSEKCINPDTSRPYTLSMLERALRDVHFSVDPKRPAKAQALEALPLLKSRFPIERARMRLKLLVPLNCKDELLELVRQQGGVVEEQDLIGSNFCLVCLVEPGIFRPVHSFIQTSSAGVGRLEVLSLAATAELEGDAPVAAAAGGVEGLSLGSSTAVRPGEARPAAPSAAGTGSGWVAAPAPATAPAPRGPRGGPAGGRGGAADSGASVVYARGPVEGLPEEHASRRERFAELDTLQPGWTVELRSRGEGGTIDAVFFSPEGECVGAYANARRRALASKQQQQAE
ncbi:ribosome maturation SBDS [Micractinium conductrix]|uniref:Ribosome maturation SBDS n=1 Tax=Micractinium conductrix TaxID=554055 RepID=A0A2P6VGW2_9CHLO|nr:ribosome maturation SBDS [Micractinium conductrix]|eukprot:PSC73308.1 ribosome maturation SBDS [Micractinium conductrix]